MTATHIDFARYAALLDKSDNALPLDAALAPDAIIEPLDIAAETERLHEDGINAGDETGWRCIDDLFTVKRGQWTVITGTPGSGKSAWVDNVMVRLAEDREWKWGVFSAENFPYSRYKAALAEIHSGKPFHRGPNERMSLEELRDEMEWIQQHFRFVTPVDGCTLDYILAQADLLIQRFKISGFTIDPWNELEHRRPGNMTEYEYLSRALGRVRNFCRSRNVHVFVVAHPRLMQKVDGAYQTATPYDISGGASWWNKADNVISIWRNYREQLSATEIHVQKIRFRECGQLGKAELFFDRVTGRFVEPRGF